MFALMQYIEKRTLKDLYDTDNIHMEIGDIRPINRIDPSLPSGGWIVSDWMASLATSFQSLSK